MKNFYQIFINTLVNRLLVLFITVSLSSSAVFACSIATQPATTQTVCQNSAPTNITIVAGGAGTFTYQWFSNTSNSNSGGTSLGASATAAAFAPPTTTVGTRYYYCTISGSCGAPVTSNTSAVIVTPITSIATQPAMAQTVCQNAAATRIKVQANGTGTLTYQWYRNATNANSGGTSLGAAAATDSFFPSTTVVGTVYYYCIISGSCGPSVTSNTSSVTITPATTIATHPSVTQTVCQNFTPTNLSIVASGTGTVTYQWYSNSVNNNTSGTLISSATNPNYTPATAIAATTFYYCIVNSTCGSLTSTTSTVLVNPPVSITTQPLAHTRVCQNSTFNVGVIASNTRGYQWQRNGVNVTVGTGDTMANYSIANAQPSNAGVFRVLVKGLTGCPDVFSNNDTLTITTLAAITTAPSTFQVCEDQSISITGVATNAASYQWLRNGLAISPSGNVQTYTKGGNPAAMSDSGIYRLIALSNMAGTTVCKADTSVAVLGAVVRKIQITTQPLAKTFVCQNSIFNAGVTAQNVTAYQWRKDGVNVTTGTGGTTANYSFPLTQPSTAGVYTVVMTGNSPCPNAISSNDTLQVTPLALITTPPVGFLVCEDQTISITGNASNAASFQWLFKNLPIASPNGTAQNFTKGGSPAVLADSGLYRLVAISGMAGATACKADTSIAVIGNVIRKVLITTQPPSNSIACVGLSFSMSIAAQNTSGFSWRLNGSPIGQTTATMTRTSFSIADTGNYSVVISGNTPCPSVTSANARVNGIVPALITVEPSGKNLCLGDSLELSINANATQFYQWRKNGVNIGGTTTSNKFKISAVNFADSGTYSVIAIAFNGCVNDTSFPAIVKVRTPLSITAPLANTDVKCIGQNTSYTIGVAGSGPYNYSWTFNGSNIGLNNPTYAKNGVSLVDSGRYIVQVQGDIACPSIKDTIDLNIERPLSISLPLANTDVKCEGQNISYTAGASGVGPFSYIWRLNGNIIGTNNANYSKNGVIVADSGRYVVRILGGGVCPAIFDTLDLDVNKSPVIVTQPNGSAPFCIGSNIILSATAANNTSIEWHKQGQGFLGQTGNNYVSAGSIATSAGNYFVIVKAQPACTDLSSNVFNVSMTNSMTILTQPVGAQLLETPPGGHTLSVTPSGSGPFGYQWFRNGILVPLATSSTYTISNYVEAIDSGSYQVRVTAPAPCNNVVFSDIVKITSIKCPKLVSGPIPAVNVCVGSPINLNASATGTKSYQWYKNNIVLTGETNAILTIPSATLDNAGVYKCMLFAQNITSCSNTFSNNAVVTVKDKPIIISQPQGSKLCEVKSHPLRVKANFAETYQWYKNGVAISPNGDKDSFVVNNLSNAGDVFYIEIKNNLCASTISNSVTIRSVKPSTSIHLANNSEIDLIERCTDENDWTYYSNSLQTEKLLIAIKKNGSNFTARPDIELMSGIREISPSNSENKGAILGRRIFNIDIVSGSVLNPYDVKVYYEVAETNAVLTRLRDLRLANPRIVTDKLNFAVLTATQQPFNSALWSNLTIPLTIPHNVFTNNIDTGRENGVNYVILKQLTSTKLGGTAYVDYILNPSSAIQQANENGFRFSLYPVPSTDGKVTVDVSSKRMKPITFTVTDMTGRVVAVFNEKHTSLESSHAFDFSQLANGNYQLILSNDEESAIGRFTISK